MFEFTDWFDGFVNELNRALNAFNPRNSPTGKDESWRRYYITAKDGQERFVMHIRPVPTKNRANVCIGLPETKFRVPDGCPPLEIRDKSHPDYREFDVPADKPKIRKITIELAVQIAKKLL